MATPQFLRFFFLTNDGLTRLGSASPGGAGRNRTLGLTALGEILVPIVPFAQQLWFDHLQEYVAAALEQQAQSAAEINALLPLILDKAFKGEL